MDRRVVDGVNNIYKPQITETPAMRNRRKWEICDGWHRINACLAVSKADESRKFSPTVQILVHDCPKDMMIIIANYNNNITNAIVNQTAFDKVCYVKRLYDIFLVEKDYPVDADGRNKQMKQVGKFTEWAEERLSVTGQCLADAIGTKQSNVRTICQNAMHITKTALDWAKELCKSEVSEVIVKVEFLSKIKLFFRVKKNDLFSIMYFL